jgi:Holliday junction resolvase RusA-like endonuclease
VNVLTARIFGMPVAQPRARARAFAVGGHTRVQMYDPPQAKDWKRTVQAQVLTQKPATPVDGPLAMRLVFHLPRPQSLPKREKWPTKRPDLDNLGKAIKDALKGVIYRDDSLIVKFTADKVYGPSPGVEIVIDHVVDAPRPQQGQLVRDEEGRI